MEIWNVTIILLFLNVLFLSIQCNGLSPKGRNVCESGTEVQCCSGWAQQGDECLIPKCEGNFTCNENEICVRPNECRCRHGYFGATCDMKCPSQFWGPDCKGQCSCHPNGQCDDVTGACTCKPNRWGVHCELFCGCQKGSCDQRTGVCSCYRGFWGTQCANSCYCSVNSVCDVASGQCHCNPGWYGRNCNAQCACNGSPCEQLTGRCMCRDRLWGTHCEQTCQCIHGRCNPADGSCTCRPGFRGKFCREPCPAGFYGQNCRHRCGHCKGQQPCKVTEGRCITCERGWNGTRCDQICANGFFGENCHEICPLCKDGHFCNRINGKCTNCNPGWMGDRCEVKCPNGTYGDNCAYECVDCFNGTCHFASGECLCNPGYDGLYCNISCPSGQYGVNCAQTCSCYDSNCDAVSGACKLLPNQRIGVISAGVLVTSLLLLLIYLLCCCCICRKTKSSAEEKSKRRLCRRFTRISSKLPRVPIRRQKLPKVVVSHHDPENTFNCSFIEPPSAVEQSSPYGSSRGSVSSAESTEDCPVYCILLHEESVKENNRKEDSHNITKTTVLSDEVDDKEYLSEVETLPEDLDEAELVSASTSEYPCEKSTASERSDSVSESDGCTLSPPAPLPSQQHNRKSAKSGETSNVYEKMKLKSSERIKPRPPDPSTKPKVSWIHGSTEPGQIQTCPAVTGEKQSARKKGSKHRQVRPEKAAVIDEAAAPEVKTATKNRPRQVPLEHINGAVQSVFRKMSSFRAKKKATNSNETPPRSPSSSQESEQKLNSEAASRLAAQLKEKTQNLSRSEGTSCDLQSPSRLQFQKLKPSIPQEGCLPGEEKFPLPAANSIQRPASDTHSNVAKSLEKEESENGDAKVKKTPIKKPPRKKDKEIHSHLKADQKVSMRPCNSVD